MRLRSDLILLLAAFIWGLAFVVQRAVANDIGVLLFTGLRFLLAAVVMLPLVRLPTDRASRIRMALPGLALSAASILQQAGLRFTTAGNSGFITGLYVLFVPLVLVVFWKQRVAPLVWVGALAAVAGLLLLSTGGALTLNSGDALTLASAFFWAWQIILLSRAVRHVDALPLAAGQFLVTGVLTTLLALLFEPGALSGLATSWWAVVATGIVSVAGGYTLQVIGLKHAPPTDAALILSLEAGFAALFGFLLLGETLNGLQMAGCGLILAGILLPQVRGAAGEPPLALDPDNVIH